MNTKLIPAFLLSFVNTMSASILFPVLPFVVAAYDAPKWVFGLLLTLYSSFQFIGSPLLGRLSDAHGRKPILLISHGGTLLSWFVFLFALYLPKTEVWGFMLPLWIIALSRILDGITGGNTSVANAYVADITTLKEKSYIFGYLGAVTGLAMILGPGIGGFSASSSYGYVGTIVVSIFISVVTLAAIFFWLKESLSKENRAPRVKESVWKMINIPGRVKAVNPNKTIKTIFTMKMLFTAMVGIYIGSIALFLIDLFGFNEKELGTFMLVVGIFLAFNQAFVSKRLIDKLGEFKTLMLGLFFCFFGLFTITLTKNLYLFIACYYVMNLGLSLCFPTFNAILAINAPDKSKGEIMGISESINSFSMAVFPVISALAYTYIEKYLFHGAALLPLVGFGIALYMRKRLK